MTTPELVAHYQTLPTSSLWTRHLVTQSARELAVVEAELVSRGQTRSGSSYIGRRSANAVGTVRFPRTAVTEQTANMHNCSDFNSSLQAQRFFLAAGGPSSDPHDLDRDGDGFACEWGPQVRKLASRSRAAIASERRPRYTATCYTGPRGGTYTVTASGNRNYDGC